MKPLAIELFAGLHGWGEGLISEGFRVVGFDIVDMCAELGHKRPEGIDLVLQDVLTLDGSQFRDAALIVASPPCQGYSYRAMPWKRAKALPPPDNSLFDACFRIQREANTCDLCHGINSAFCKLCKGVPRRYIPMVVENVKGAQPWVGRAAWHYGSFYLWGDVPALMPMVRGRKNNGGSWFAIGSPGQTELGRNPDGRKVAMNFHEHEKTGKPGRSFQSCAVAEHQKQPVWFNDDKRRGEKCGGDWFGAGADCSLMRRMSSKSSARKAASAAIAKIPMALAQHIARVYWEAR